MPDKYAEEMEKQFEGIGKRKRIISDAEKNALMRISDPVRPSDFPFEKEEVSPRRSPDVKKKRLERNRVSARESRKRKKYYIEALEKQVFLFGFFFFKVFRCEIWNLRF